MENKFSAQIDLIKENEKVMTFHVLFKNRPVVGDLMSIDNLLLGEKASNKIECGLDDDDTENERKYVIDILKKHKIDLNSTVEVKKVYIYPILNVSCVDFSAEVRVIL